MANWITTYSTRKTVGRINRFPSFIAGDGLYFQTTDDLARQPDDIVFHYAVGCPLGSDGLEGADGSAGAEGSGVLGSAGELGALGSAGVGAGSAGAGAGNVIVVTLPTSVGRIVKACKAVSCS